MEIKKVPIQTMKIVLTEEEQRNLENVSDLLEQLHEKLDLYNDLYDIVDDGLECINELLDEVVVES